MKDKYWTFDNLTIDVSSAANGETDPGNFKAILVNFTMNPRDTDRFDGITANGFTEKTEISSQYAKVIQAPNGATLAQIQAYLRGIKCYSLANPDGQRVKFAIVPEDVKERTFYLAKTGHYYQFVNFSDDPNRPWDNRMTWLQCYETAKGKRFLGRDGYLATVTSKEEDDEMFEISNRKVGWLGGTILRKPTTVVNDSSGKPIYYQYAADASSKYFDEKPNDPRYRDGKNFPKGLNIDGWYWACGPERGEIFFDTMLVKRSVDGAHDLTRVCDDGVTRKLHFDVCTTAWDRNAKKGYYFNWKTSIGSNPEPNWGDYAYGGWNAENPYAEPCLTTLLIGSGYASKDERSWNNIMNNRHSRNEYDPVGYFVEYGNLKQGNDPAVPEGTVEREPDLPGQYKITFHVNGGTAADGASQERYFLTTIVTNMHSLASLGFSAPEGRYFYGWAKSASATKPELDETQATLNYFRATTENHLYAVWTDKPVLRGDITRFASTEGDSCRWSPLQARVLTLGASDCDGAVTDGGCAPSRYLVPCDPGVHALQIRADSALVIDAYSYIRTWFDYPRPELMQFLVTNTSAGAEGPSLASAVDDGFRRFGRELQPNETAGICILTGNQPYEGRPDAAVLVGGLERLVNNQSVGAFVRGDRSGKKEQLASHLGVREKSGAALPEMLKSVGANRGFALEFEASGWYAKAGGSGTSGEHHGFSHVADALPAGSWTGIDPIEVHYQYDCVAPADYMSWKLFRSTSGGAPVEIPHGAANANANGEFFEVCDGYLRLVVRDLGAFGIVDPMASELVFEGCIASSTKPDGNPWSGDSSCWIYTNVTAKGEWVYDKIVFELFNAGDSGEVKFGSTLGATKVEDECEQRTDYSKLVLTNATPQAIAAIAAWMNEPGFAVYDPGNMDDDYFRVTLLRNDGNGRYETEVTLPAAMYTVVFRPSIPGAGKTVTNEYKNVRVVNVPTVAELGYSVDGKYFYYWREGETALLDDGQDFCDLSTAFKTNFLAAVWSDTPVIRGECPTNRTGGVKIELVSVGEANRVTGYVLSAGAPHGRYAVAAPEGLYDLVYTDADGYSRTVLVTNAAPGGTEGPSFVGGFRASSKVDNSSAPASARLLAGGFEPFEDAAYRKCVAYYEANPDPDYDHFSRPEITLLASAPTENPFGDAATDLFFAVKMRMHFNFLSYTDPTYSYQWPEAGADTSEDPCELCGTNALLTLVVPFDTARYEGVACSNTWAVLRRCGNIAETLTTTPNEEGECVELGDGYLIVRTLMLGTFGVHAPVLETAFDLGAPNLGEEEDVDFWTFAGASGSGDVMYSSVVVDVADTTSGWTFPWFENFADIGSQVFTNDDATAILKLKQPMTAGEIAAFASSNLYVFSMLELAGSRITVKLCTDADGQQIGYTSAALELPSLCGVIFYNPGDGARGANWGYDYVFTNSVTWLTGVEYMTNAWTVADGKHFFGWASETSAGQAVYGDTQAVRGRFELGRTNVLTAVWSDLPVASGGCQTNQLADAVVKLVSVGETNVVEGMVMDGGAEPARYAVAAPDGVYDLVFTDGDGFPYTELVALETGSVTNVPFFGRTVSTCFSNPGDVKPIGGGFENFVASVYDLCTNRFETALRPAGYTGMKTPELSIVSEPAETGDDIALAFRSEMCLKMALTGASEGVWPEAGEGHDASEDPFDVCETNGLLTLILPFDTAPYADVAYSNTWVVYRTCKGVETNLTTEANADGEGLELGDGYVLIRTTKLGSFALQAPNLETTFDLGDPELTESEDDFLWTFPATAGDGDRVYSSVLVEVSSTAESTRIRIENAVEIGEVSGTNGESVATLKLVRPMTASEIAAFFAPNLSVFSMEELSGTRITVKLCTDDAGADVGFTSETKELASLCGIVVFNPGSGATGTDWAADVALTNRTLTLTPVSAMTNAWTVADGKHFFGWASETSAGQAVYGDTQAVRGGFELGRTNVLTAVWSDFPVVRGAVATNAAAKVSLTGFTNGVDGVVFAGGAEVNRYAVAAPEGLYDLVLSDGSGVRTVLVTNGVDGASGGSCDSPDPITASTKLTRAEDGAPVLVAGLEDAVGPTGEVEVVSASTNGTSSAAYEAIKALAGGQSLTYLDLSYRKDGVESVPSSPVSVLLPCDLSGVLDFDGAVRVFRADGTAAEEVPPGEYVLSEDGLLTLSMSAPGVYAVGKSEPAKILDCGADTIKWMATGYRRTSFAQLNLKKGTGDFSRLTDPLFLFQDRTSNRVDLAKLWYGRLDRGVDQPAPMTVTYGGAVYRAVPLDGLKEAFMSVAVGDTIKYGVTDASLKTGKIKLITDVATESIIEIATKDAKTGTQIADAKGADGLLGFIVWSTGGRATNHIALASGEQGGVIAYNATVDSIRAKMEDANGARPLDAVPLDDAQLTTSMAVNLMVDDVRKVAVRIDRLVASGELVCGSYVVESDGLVGSLGGNAELAVYGAMTTDGPWARISELTVNKQEGTFAFPRGGFNYFRAAMEIADDIQ